MRKKIENYQGYEVTQEVITRINTLSFIRYSEGRYGLLHEDYESFEELCILNNLISEQTRITLGEDWFIVYSIGENCVELNEWVSLENVPNKFAQTMEMFNEIKKILLSSEEKKLIALMKHNTSYKFYSDFIKRGFLKEHNDHVTIDPLMPSDVEKVAHNLTEQYGYLGYFLQDANRSKIKEEIIEDYIYHDTEFVITNKFKTRYKK